MDVVTRQPITPNGAERAICTVGAPDAVFTVRTYGLWVVAPPIWPG